MYTIFRPDLDAFARATLAEQQRLQSGDWEPGELRDLQLQRVADTARYVREHSPFYAKLFAAADVPASGPITPEQLARLPFTTKDDLRSGMFDVVSLPIDRAWIFYETTGTTGRATPCPRSDHDSIVNNTALTLAYREIFEQHGDKHVVAVMGPTELHSTGDTFGDVMHNLGHTVVKMWPHSPLVGFPRALALLEKLGVTALICTPGMAISLAKAAGAAGIDIASRLGVRLILCVGELTSPAMLENLGGQWNARVYNCMYASQEASIMAACHADGQLRTVPVSNYYEVIDPATAQPVEPVDGVREGELVITHLYQGAKPLVRYRTGDMVRLSAQPGSVTEVMRPIGRVRDALLLGGELVTAYDLEQTIFSHLSGVLDYFISLDEVDGRDTVTITVETVDEIAGLRIDRERVGRAVGEAFGVGCTVAVAAVGTITSTGAMVSWKAARIHDRRVTDSAEREAALAIAAGRDSR